MLGSSEACGSGRSIVISGRVMVSSCHVYVCGVIKLESDRESVRGVVCVWVVCEGGSMRHEK